MKTALLIPTYQPKANVLPFLSSFRGDEFDLFLLVDDGSGEAYVNEINSIYQKTCFEVLSYPVNKGKGAAIKTGIEHLLSREDSPDVIVTADSDGQHLYEDILRVRDEALSHPDALVLGVRDFSGKDVPKRSRAGNRISSFYVRLQTGEKLGDTQTGLRAIPRCLYPQAVEIEGSRYDYEFNFLIDAIKEHELRTIPIDTVYEDNNAGSHFHAVKDSLRVYRPFFVQLLLTLACWAADLGIFYLTYEALSPTHGGRLAAIAFAATLAKLVAGTAHTLGVCRFATPNQKLRTTKAMRYGVTIGFALLLEISWTYAFASRTFGALPTMAITEIALAILTYFTITFLRGIKRRENHERQITTLRLHRLDRD